MSEKRKTKLRQAIEQAGIKPVDIAAKINVGRSNVSRQMSIGIKTIRVAQKYAAVLGCEPVELLDL